MSAGTQQLVRRVCSLVRTLDRSPRTRDSIAMMWRVTPRSVNMTISRARTLFGVRVEHVPGEGYVLRDTGILNRAAIIKGGR